MITESFFIVILISFPAKIQHFSEMGKCHNIFYRKEYILDKRKRREKGEGGERKGKRKEKIEREEKKTKQKKQPQIEIAFCGAYENSQFCTYIIDSQNLRVKLHTKK